MRDWLSIPILQNALWVLGAGVVIPLTFGLVARIFFKRDEDDEKNDPHKAHLLRTTIRTLASPEKILVNGEPWPLFKPSPKSVSGSKTD